MQRRSRPGRQAARRSGRANRPPRRAIRPCCAGRVASHHRPAPAVYGGRTSVRPAAQPGTVRSGGPDVLDHTRGRTGSLDGVRRAEPDRGHAGRARAGLPRPSQALRRADGGGRGRLRDRGRRDVRPPRAQRRREDHLHLHDLRPPPPRRGRGHGGRPAGGRRGDRRQGRDRLRPAGPGHLPRPHGPREPALLRAPAAAPRQGAGPPRRRGPGADRPRRSRRAIAPTRSRAG